MTILPSAFGRWEAFRETVFQGREGQAGRGLRGQRYGGARLVRRQRGAGRDHALVAQAAARGARVRAGPGFVEVGASAPTAPSGMPIVARVGSVELLVPAGAEERDVACAMRAAASL